MSSSPSRSPAALPPAPGGQAEATPFIYCEVTAPAGASWTGPVQPGPGDAEGSSALAHFAEREAQARELGRRQGEQESRAKFEEQLVRERAGVAQALADFARERADYYQKIEKEAVLLALSIARKILHREAQVDPLLLMGILRVALDRIEGATGVVLAVHPQQATVWRSYLISRMGPGELPEVVEDPAMALEQCQLRTSMGTADLGLEVQLKEIEQGLMDLLAARPREREKKP
jgi:flagellar assembly protein FliH